MPILSVTIDPIDYLPDLPGLVAELAATYDVPEEAVAEVLLTVLAPRTDLPA